MAIKVIALESRKAFLIWEAFLHFLSIDLQCIFDVGFDVGNLDGRLVTLQHLTVAADEELGEVPLDVAVLVVVGIALAKHVVYPLTYGIVDIKASKAFLCFEPREERMGLLAVDINLIELGELDVVLQRTELMDLLNGARCLFPKLIAGEVENLKATLMELLVE